MVVAPRRGRLQRTHTVTCATCEEAHDSTVTLYASTIADATRQLYAAGWANSRVGWRCADCKGKRLPKEGLK